MAENEEKKRRLILTEEEFRKASQLSLIHIFMAETGADYGMNGGLFSGSKSLCNVKADGKVVNDPGWTEYGYAWNTGPDISMDIIPNSKKNYIGCVQLKAGKAPAYQPDMGGKRGRTAMGLAGSNLVLYCTGDGTADASTPEDLHTELLQKFQCDSALMLDGGGSSQCDFKGKKITASRVVANLDVYKRQELSLAAGLEQPGDGWDHLL